MDESVCRIRLRLGLGDEAEAWAEAKLGGGDFVPALPAPQSLEGSIR